MPLPSPSLATPPADCTAALAPLAPPGVATPTWTNALTPEQQARANEFTAAWTQSFEALRPLRERLLRDADRIICEMHADLAATSEVIRTICETQGVDAAAHLAVEQEQLFTSQWEQLLSRWLIHTMHEHNRMIAEGARVAIGQALRAQPPTPGE